MLANVSVGVASMALFAKTTDPKKLLADARKNRDGLIKRKKDSEAAATEYREKSRALARDGADDAALDKTEAAMRAKLDRVPTLTASIGDIERDIADLEVEIAHAADQRARGETAKAIDVLIERRQADQDVFVEATSALKATSRESRCSCSMRTAVCNRKPYPS
jgi:hypothetical protein